MSKTQESTAPAPEAPNAPPPPPPLPPTPEPGRLSPLLAEIISRQDMVEEAKGIISFEMESRWFAHSQRQGEVFLLSGWFTDVKSLAQAATKIELGRNWGMTASDAMRFVYLVKGRPAVMEEYFASRMTEAGWEWDPLFVGGMGVGCRGVHLMMKFKGEKFMVQALDPTTGLPMIKPVTHEPVLEQLRVSFLEADAAGITIWENDRRVTLLEKKGPWADGHRDMMFYWRALSKFRRLRAPNILKGALTKDEAMDLEPVAGSVDEWSTPKRQEKASAAEPEKSTIAAEIDEALKGQRRGKGTRKEREEQKEETKDQKTETAAPAEEKPLEEKPVDIKPVEAATPVETKPEPKLDPKPDPAPAEPSQPVTVGMLTKLRDMKTALGPTVFEDCLRQGGVEFLKDVTTADLADKVLGFMRARIKP